MFQRAQHELPGVGEPGFLAAHGPDSHTLVVAEAAFANDPVLDAPALLATHLEIQVRVVDARTHHRAQRRIEMPFIEPGGLEQARHHGIDGIVGHGWFRFARGDTRIRQ